MQPFLTAMRFPGGARHPEGREGQAVDAARVLVLRAAHAQRGRRQRPAGVEPVLAGAAARAQGHEGQFVDQVAGLLTTLLSSGNTPGIDTEPWPKFRICGGGGGHFLREFKDEGPAVINTQR